MDKRLGRLSAAPGVAPRHTASLHCIVFNDTPPSPTKGPLSQTTSLANLDHHNTEKSLSLLSFATRRSQGSILSTSGSCYSPVTEDCHSDSSDNCTMVTGLNRLKRYSSDYEVQEAGSIGSHNSVMVTVGAAKRTSEQLDQIAEESLTTRKLDSRLALPGPFVSKPIPAKIKKKHLRHPDLDKSKVWSKSTHVKIGKEITHVKFAIQPGITSPTHGSTHTCLLVIAHLSKNQCRELERGKTSYKIRVSCEASEDSQLKFREPLTVAFERGEEQLRYQQNLMSRHNLDQCIHDIITLTFTTTIFMQPIQQQS